MNLSEDQLKALRHPTSQCPNCGKTLDAAHNVTGEQANKVKPGDISLCIDCTAILVFDDELFLRRPTPQELEDFKSEAENWRLILRAQNLIQRTRPAFMRRKQARFN
jgi:hypothetical protein